MNNFVNEYEHNDECIKEQAKAWTRRRAYSNYLLIEDIILFIVSCLIIAFHNTDGNIYLGELGIFFAIYPTLNYYLSVSRFVKTNKARLKLMQLSSFKVRYEITDQKLVMCRENEDDKKELALSDVEDFFESKNFYHIAFKGMVLVGIKKDSFVEGNAEGFEKFSSKFPKGKNKWPIIAGIATLVIILILLGGWII